VNSQTGSVESPTLRLSAKIDPERVGEIGTKIMDFDSPGAHSFHPGGLNQHLLSPNIVGENGEGSEMEKFNDTEFV